MDELEWTDLPFYEQFFNEHGDYFDKKSLDPLNLRMRLKLLASVAGESNELAIDYFAEEPTICLVHRADAAYPLKGLSFADFVAWFSKFGTWRWYFAFLDKKAEASLNIDLARSSSAPSRMFRRRSGLPSSRACRRRKRPAPCARRCSPPPSDPAGRPPVLPAAESAACGPRARTYPRRVAFSPDGQRLVVWGANYELFVHDVGRRERAVEAEARGGDGPVRGRPDRRGARATRGRTSPPIGSCCARAPRASRSIASRGGPATSSRLWPVSAAAGSSSPTPPTPCTSSTSPRSGR